MYPLWEGLCNSVHWDKRLLKPASGISILFQRPSLPAKEVDVFATLVDAVKPAMGEGLILFLAVLSNSIITLTALCPSQSCLQE